MRWKLARALGTGMSFVVIKPLCVSGRLQEVERMKRTLGSVTTQRGVFG